MSDWEGVNADAASVGLLIGRLVVGLGPQNEPGERMGYVRSPGSCPRAVSGRPWRH
jgi:hypothetical protein